MSEDADGLPDKTQMYWDYIQKRWWFAYRICPFCGAKVPDSRCGGCSAVRTDIGSKAGFIKFALSCLAGYVAYVWQVTHHHYVTGVGEEVGKRWGAVFGGLLVGLLRVRQAGFELD
jgi:hypothetical protein